MTTWDWTSELIRWQIGRLQRVTADVEKQRRTA